MKLLAGLGLVSTSFAANTNTDKPNIVFILSDDQGYADIPWKNPKVQMPNLDRMKKKGMQIDGAYSQHRCTPSRVSFLTGKYNWKLGFGEGVLSLGSPAGIRTKEKLVSQYMKAAGYDTHMYGKWHVGMCDESLLPTARGFDTFRGFWGSGGIGYYDHKAKNVHDYWISVGDTYEERISTKWSCDEFTQDALETLEERQTTGDTDPFFMYMAYNAPHSPYETPDSSIVAEFDNIPDSRRQILLGMLNRVDTNIGSLLTKLEKIGELDNTIVVFQSDNGPNEAGSAFPLRGAKGQWTEGGTRVPSVIMGPGIEAGSVLHRTKFMHLTDWLPTFADYAGLDIPNSEFADIALDGYSFRDAFENGADSPRSDLFHHVDESRAGVYRKGDYKLYFRSSATFISGANHTEPSEGVCGGSNMLDDVDTTFPEIQALSGTVPVNCLTTNCRKNAMLFNIKDDPYELINIYDDAENIGAEMMANVISAADAVTESAVNVQATTDEGELADPLYVDNSGKTSWGWCDPSAI